VKAVVVLVSKEGFPFAAIGPFDDREQAEKYVEPRNETQGGIIVGYVVPLTERDE